MNDPLQKEASLSLINVLKHEASDWRVYQEMGAGAYRLCPSFDWDDEAVANLYAYFLSSLCGTDYTVHVWLDTADDWGYQELAEALRALEPSVQTSFLGRREVRNFRPAGWRAKVFEIVLSTKDPAVFRLLFARGSPMMFTPAWILDRAGRPLPLMTLRRVNLAKFEYGFMDSVLREHAAVIPTKEAHGPYIFTLHLPEERIVAAAQKAAADLGVRLLLRLD